MKSFNWPAAAAAIALVSVGAVVVLAQPASQSIPGYTYGTATVAKSPLTLKDLESLRKTLLFTDEDVKYLRMSKAILADQTDQVLDVWYGFVASTPELVFFFGNKETGKPEGEYLARVRARFSQWILDTADANFDQKWLDYQHEIALRHNKAKKNATDNAPSVPQINYRYIPALTIPITTTLKPFLAKKGASAEDVEKMHAAWVKAVLLQSILWGEPYVKEGQF
jgi:hypothetical protein